MKISTLGWILITLLATAIYGFIQQKTGITPVPTYIGLCLMAGIFIYRIIKGNP